MSERDNSGLWLAVAMVALTWNFYLLAAIATNTTNMDLIATDTDQGMQGVAGPDRGGDVGTAVAVVHHHHSTALSECLLTLGAAAALLCLVSTLLWVRGWWVRRRPPVQIPAPTVRRPTVHRPGRDLHPVDPDPRRSNTND